jgi:DNA repair protein RecO (recombination protein O)
MALILPAGGAGRAVRMRNAATMPLSQVEFQCVINTAKEFQKVSSITLQSHYRTIYFNPFKNAIAQFVAEFLSRFLRDTVPDKLMYNYIASSLELLDEMDKGLANFHIAFLSGLAYFVGIAPDVSTYSSGRVFDMRAGRYDGRMPLHKDILTGESAQVPLMLSRMNFANLQLFRFSRERRVAILEGILKYYELHFPGCGHLNSLEVLVKLFD